MLRKASVNGSDDVGRMISLIQTAHCTQNSSDLVSLVTIEQGWP